MRNSFVGLVGRGGLEALLPENAATCRWSLAAAGSRPRVRACVWAVLEPALAAEVIDLLADGEALAALRFLSLAAESLGPLTPPEPEAARPLVGRR